MIAIIAILVSLLLPAVQQAREAARRTQCKNNMKQLGLALMNYESSYKVFPPEKITFIGTSAQSWTTMVLPFIDQQPLYDAYNFSTEWCDPSNWQVTQANLPGWVCPSAPEAGVRRHGRRADQRRVDRGSRCRPGWWIRLGRLHGAQRRASQPVYRERLADAPHPVAVDRQRLRDSRAD